jgi:hypothetical protein
MSERLARRWDERRRAWLDLPDALTATYVGPLVNARRSSAAKWFINGGLALLLVAFDAIQHVEPAATILITAVAVGGLLALWAYRRRVLPQVPVLPIGGSQRIIPWWRAPRTIPVAGLCLTLFSLSAGPAGWSIVYLILAMITNALVVLGAPAQLYVPAGWRAPGALGVLVGGSPRRA